MMDDDDDALRERLRTAFTYGAQIVPQKTVTGRHSLEEIGAECGTDKAAALGAHDYCHIYDDLFTPLRDEPIVLLELGWGGYNDPRGGGCSAAMWREYFTKADINIIDVEPKVCAIPKVRLFCGSQDDRDFLAEVHAETGDYDIVIDDASHESFRTMKSFSLLWPRVKSGGFYVVEDLHVQEAAVKRFSRLAEDHLLLHDEDVEWISFHHELVIIRKR